MTGGQLILEWLSNMECTEERGWTRDATPTSGCVQSQRGVIRSEERMGIHLLPKKHVLDLRNWTNNSLAVLPGVEIVDHLHVILVKERPHG